jgi:hypothetical protein
MAILKNGYNLIYKNGKHVYEHRYKIEQKIGRKLLSTEHVHHKNGNRSDNRLYNLLLVIDIQEHLKAHKHWGRPLQPPCFCGLRSHGRNLCRHHYYLFKTLDKTRSLVH